jgi:putative heme degradation protein
MEQQRSAGQAGNVDLPNWVQWQRAVLALLRADVSGVLRSIQIDDVDWDAWHLFYMEGRSPRAAIDRALARDF